MKKIALAAGIAASLSMGTQAATYDVSSEISGFSMFLGTFNLFDADLNTEPGKKGYWENLKFAGTLDDVNNDGVLDNGGNITFTGTAVFNAGPDVRLTFDLSGGYMHMASGVLMNAGTVLIETNTGTGYEVYSTVDASIDHFSFLKTSDQGHVGQATEGLILSPIAMNTGDRFVLPGLWDGVIFGPGNGLIDAGVSSVSLFGNQAGVYMDGEVTLTAVPTPTAVLLFGSALMILAGIRSKKRINT